MDADDSNSCVWHIVYVDFIVIGGDVGSDGDGNARTLNLHFIKSKSMNVAKWMSMCVCQHAAHALRWLSRNAIILSSRIVFHHADI